MSKARLFYCSFCGKSNTETTYMLAGPASVAICEECIEQGVAQLREKAAYDAEMARIRHCADVVVNGT